MIRTILALWGLASLLSGCATVFSHSHDTVEISSNPSGAVVFVDAQPVGQTPMQYSFPRRAGEQGFRLEKQGYYSRDQTLEKRVDNRTFFNTICLVCYVIDFASGKMYEPLKQQVVNLSPTQNTELGSSDFTTMRMRAEKEWTALCGAMGHTKGSKSYADCMAKQQDVYLERSKAAEQRKLIRSLDGDKAILIDAR